MSRIPPREPRWYSWAWVGGTLGGPAHSSLCSYQGYLAVKKLYKKLSYAVNTWRLRSAREACALVGFTTRVPPSPLVCVGGCWSQTDRITCTYRNRTCIRCAACGAGRVHTGIKYSRVNINCNYISCTNNSTYTVDMCCRLMTVSVHGGKK